MILNKSKKLTEANRGWKQVNQEPVFLMSLKINSPIEPQAGWARLLYHPSYLCISISDSNDDSLSQLIWKTSKKSCISYMLMQIYKLIKALNLIKFLSWLNLFGVAQTSSRCIAFANDNNTPSLQQSQKLMNRSQVTEVLKWL